MSKLIDTTALSGFWSKAKEFFLSGGKIKTSLLPAMKTVNGESILGTGNIEIDLTLYRLVDSLPTTGIDETKIYIVPGNATETGNAYAEYIYVTKKDNSKVWEKIGEFKTDVDLSGYMKKTDLAANTGLKLSGTTVQIDNAVTSVSTPSLVKVKYNAQGLVTGSTAVAKADITALGIPAQDTTYSDAVGTSEGVAGSHGLMSLADKNMLDGMTVASETDINAIFNA